MVIRLNSFLTAIDFAPAATKNAGKISDKQKTNPNSLTMSSRLEYTTLLTS